jgi:uncharacterized repeat protein (TIGR02543 family)
MDADKTVTATFTHDIYTLTVNKVGNGTVTPDKVAPYYLNDVVVLTAVADAGWTFSGWTGDCTGTGDTCSVTMDTDKTVTATFTITSTGLTAGTYDDDNAAWAYSGGWYSMASVGSYADTLHYSTVVGNDTQVTFTGRQIKLIYLASPISGSVDIYIDGTKVASINQYDANWNWQKTWTSDLLTAGNHNLRVVHVSGDFTTIDAITVIATPVILSTGVYDEADPAFSYEGTWYTISATGPYADTLHYSVTAGHDAQVAFNGQQIKLAYLASPYSGSMDVYVDGVKVKTIDQHDVNWDWQKTWTSDLLPAGDHSLRIVHVSGDLTSIDALTVISTPVALTNGVYDEADPAFSYEGRWYTISSDASPYAGTLHYSVTAGNNTEVVFSGKQIKLTYLASPYSGIVDIYMDGAKVTSIDQHSVNWDWQKTWTSDLIPAGIHSLRVVHASGDLTSIDAISVIATPVILSTGVYDEFDPAFSYEGRWLTMESVTGPYADTLHYSYGMGESVQVVFTGQQVKLTYLAAPTAGIVDVYIDGVKVITIDQYSPNWDWQTTWTSELLSVGDHSLRVVHASEGSSSFGNIDAVTVMP